MFSKIKFNYLFFQKCEYCNEVKPLKSFTLVFPMEAAVNIFVVNGTGEFQFPSNDGFLLLFVLRTIQHFSVLSQT